MTIEAEQSVLGAMMLVNDSFDEVADIIAESDFYRKDHQVIFRAISNLAEQGQPFDVVTVSEWLKSNDNTNLTGGLAYVGTIANNTPGATNVKAYARIVLKHSKERQLRNAAQQIAELCDSALELDEKLDKAQAVFFKFTASNQSKQPIKLLREILPTIVDRIDARSNNPGAITGLSTGFGRLDEKLAGLHPSNLIVLAGRPSMGKSALALNILENVCIKQGKATAIFSLEMSGEEITERLTATCMRKNFQEFRTGAFGDDDWLRLTSVVSQLAKAPFFIDDTSLLSIMELRARARRLKRKHDIQLIVVDYLQLMTASGENKTDRVGNISAGLKALAKELNVPVIALSQLNRSLANRTDQRPVMSDIRDSGAIEQDADVILFLYRDEVYNKSSPAKGVAELNIGKQRNGPLGAIPLTFIGELVRFENYEGPPLEEIYRQPSNTKKRSNGFDY